MRGAAGPRPAMAPPAAFIPPTLLLFIIGPAAPKEGENRRDPKTNFFPFFSPFFPPFQTLSHYLRTFSFFSPPPSPTPPQYFIVSPFFGGDVGWGGGVAMKLSASLPESSQRFGLWGTVGLGFRGGAKETF